MQRLGMIHLSLITSVALGGIACGGGDGDGRVSRATTAFSDVTDAVCSCYDGAEQQECLSDPGEDSDDISCDIGVMEDAGLGSTIDCLIDELDALADCLNSATCDELAREACFDGDSTCTEVPDAVEVQIQMECGEPPFICDNGDTIPNDWRCDGDEDCSDASDEVGCSS